MEYFDFVKAVKYEGPASKNPYAFKFYNADEVILGKKMSEHLPFAMAWWHNLGANGVDMFGRGTIDKSFGATPNTLEHAKAKVDAGFEFMKKNMAKNEANLLVSQTSSTVVSATDGAMVNSTFYLDSVVNKMVGTLVKKLRETLTKYADVAILNISELVPEFLYYIRCAERISRLMEKGCVFCEAQPITAGQAKNAGMQAANDTISMEALDFYNLKLAMNMENVNEIVPNDLIFDRKNTVYILTGANRGGKTTMTQAVGQLFVLAQGGLFVPAKKFRYVPCDCIFTHFPADEDKTMDLGRLGEECVRFKEMFSKATDKSLMLLNETFSTTSFEEGYYIAKDSVKALLNNAVRTIYNTHMHKLGEDAEELTRESMGAGAASLVMKTEEGKRSFKVTLSKPEGSSYAKNIDEKYGVTYDMLIGVK